MPFPNLILLFDLNESVFPSYLQQQDFYFFETSK